VSDLYPVFNNRKPYFPDKHCGHPIDRSVDSLRTKRSVVIQKTIALQEQQAVGPLTKSQQSTLQWLGRRVEFYSRAIEKIQRDGPDDRPCMQPKGRGTDHPGAGKCKVHCECRGTHGGHLSTYSRRSKDKKLSEFIDELEASEMDLLDQAPELLMLRAKLRLFLDAKQDFEPETIRSITFLQEQLRRTIETINNKRFQQMISVEVLNLLLFRMGDVLHKYISDPEVLNRIAEDWNRIAIETSPKKKALTAGVQVSI
jgi:hypothetical protein